MNTQNVTKIFVGDGANTGTSIATMVAGDILIAKRDMSLLSAGDTISDSDVIYIVQGDVNNHPVFSDPISGSTVSKFEGEAYRTKSKQTTHVGYNRGSVAGINVANNTEYGLSIIFKFDKQLWSKRQLRRVFNYTSDTNATGKEICENLAALIIKESRLGRGGDFSVLDVVVVGDGTGVLTTATINGETVSYHGITGATNYGLEITSKELTVNAFDKYERIYFSVKLSSGFDSTTIVTETQAAKYGSGEYGQIHDIEKFAQGNKGITNFRGFPIPTPDYYATNTGNFVAIPQTAAATTADDEITFSAAPVGVSAGSLITAAGVTGTLEVKYMKTSTIAVLTSAVDATITVGAVTNKQLYDMYIIRSFDTNSSGEINGRTISSPKQTIVAIPANQAQGIAFEALINPWMASTPGAFASIVL